MSMRITVRMLLMAASFCALGAQAAGKFAIEEATIDSIHAGIRAGAVT